MYQNNWSAPVLLVTLLYNLRGLDKNRENRFQVLAVSKVSKLFGTGKMKTLHTQGNRRPQLTGYTWLWKYHSGARSQKVREKDKLRTHEHSNTVSLFDRITNGNRTIFRNLRTTVGFFRLKSVPEVVLFFSNIQPIILRIKFVFL